MSGGLLSLDLARERILAGVEPLGSETVAIGAALGRILAAPLVARVDLPPFDNAAMDGYAVRAADVAGATDAAPARLVVVGDVRAGADAAAGPGPGEAVRIATGAPLPAGADTVVQVELTTPVDADGRTGERGRDATGPLPAACLVHAALPAGAAVRRRGEDVRAGQELASAGSEAGAALVAIASGSGNPTLDVHRRPRVAVLVTGDEVRPAGEPLPPGGLPDANGPGLRALVVESGGEAVELGIARDRLEEVIERLRTGIAGADVVVASGGVSVGPYDMVKPAFEAVGRIELWRVAIQPGKPLTYGEAEAPDGRRVLLFGLPGNPVSAFVTFELFVRPVLRRLAGRRDILRPVDRGRLMDPVSTSAGRRTFVRVVAERDPDGAERRDGSGRVLLRLAGGQGSHVLSGLVAAEGLAVIPEELGDAPAGTDVPLWWLRR
ncbi:MAG: hypothetical protein RL338_1212 [Chloroflexota bacterium]